MANHPHIEGVRSVAGDSGIWKRKFRVSGLRFINLKLEKWYTDVLSMNLRRETGVSPRRR